MYVSGFSFIKDALIYDYPVVESIKSILPLCDEFVIAVGESTDNTLEIIRQIDSEKIKIIETKWDESLREGGEILAIETNKAFAGIAEKADWAFYLQGDEVIHEKDLDTIYQEMLRYRDAENVDGLLLKYLHFFGSYHYTGASSNWYSHEIRIIKNDKSIYSYKDAQGFRKGQNQKLRAIEIDAFVYHYGWVRDSRAMQLKQEKFNKYWHDDTWIEQNVVKANEFDYSQHITELKPFSDSHPALMKKRIQDSTLQFEYDIATSKQNLKDKVKNFIQDNFGINLGYQNYIIVEAEDL